ncbi:hypothetical protein [Arthrobacter castelli]|uniref:hypothetical protein n=1 Tax=Arthrobacter castelli TaxID=271431 RepID=UPI00041C55F0|nr:hypothetical protein [Arthrobacter castelli]
MTTFPTETVGAYPGGPNAADVRTDPHIRLHGFDAAVVRTGTALAQWGRHRALRRSAARSAQQHRLRLQAEHGETRSMATARSHSQLLP